MDNLEEVPISPERLTRMFQHIELLAMDTPAVQRLAPEKRRLWIAQAVLRRLQERGNGGSPVESEPLVPV